MRALELASERNLDLSADAEEQLRRLTAGAVDVLVAEGKVADDEAVARVSANLDRLTAQIQSLQPEPRRGGREVPVTGRRVNRALDSLCPGFWPFC